MKTVKKLFFLLLLPALFSISDASAIPQEKKQAVKKLQAKRVIRRTAVVIRIAHKKVKEGKVYTGNLAKSIAHQKFARKLYRSAKFYRAIHQSRRAKQLAILAIKANKGQETNDMRFSKEDEDAMKGDPSDEELDKELQNEMPGESMKDEEVLNSEPDVDIKEDE